MKAAFITKPGPADELQYGERPTPLPQASEALVRIRAASINPIDTYLRSGLVAAALPKPYIPGCDFAGVIEAIGEGVSRFRVGDRVWGSNQGLAGRQGTLAEYAAIDEKWLYPLPDAIADPDAAAIALVGITAHLGLFDRTNLVAGETLFVNGGTGGVGAAVIQMAKATGARVITTVGSEEKAKHAKELGADHVLNYKSDDLSAAIKSVTNGRGVDVWFETQPPTDLDRTFDLMAARGRVVLMAGRAARPVFPNGPFYVKGLALYGFAMFNATPDEQRACAERITHWIATGQLKATIGCTFALSQAAEAHQLQEDNTLKKAGTLSGKIVVIPG